MVFALLIAAIIWNLGTWSLGLAGFELAHADRLDHRRRRRQRSAERAQRHLGRRLGPGDHHRQGASDLAAGRLRLFRPPAAGHEVPDQASRSSTPSRSPIRRRRWWVRGAADLHLHRRLLRAWLERRPEGHGPDHADPHRHRADRLCAEPRRPGQRCAGLRAGLRRRVQDRRLQGRRLCDHRRPASGRHRLRARQKARRRRLSLARRPDPRRRGAR